MPDTNSHPTPPDDVNTGFKPNVYELEVLRILNGEDIPGWTWGAAMAVCCESLLAMGLANLSYGITEKGKEYLNVLRLAQSQ